MPFVREQSGGTTISGYLYIDFRPTGNNTYYFYCKDGNTDEKSGATSGTHSYSFTDISISQNNNSLTFTFPNAVNGYIAYVSQKTTASRDKYFYVIDNSNSFTMTANNNYYAEITVMW